MTTVLEMDDIAGQEYGGLAGLTLGREVATVERFWKLRASRIVNLILGRE
jgi:hypothetical protein